MHPWNLQTASVVDVLYTLSQSDNNPGCAVPGLRCKIRKHLLSQPRSQTTIQDVQSRFVL